MIFRLPVFSNMVHCCMFGDRWPSYGNPLRLRFSIRHQPDGSSPLCTLPSFGPPVTITLLPPSFPCAKLLCTLHKHD